MMNASWPGPWWPPLQCLSICKGKMTLQKVSEVGAEHPGTLYSAVTQIWSSLIFLNNHRVISKKDLTTSTIFSSVDFVINDSKGSKDQSLQTVLEWLQLGLPSKGALIRPTSHRPSRNSTHILWIICSKLARSLYCSALNLDYLSSHASEAMDGTMDLFHLCCSWLELWSERIQEFLGFELFYFVCVFLLQKLMDWNLTP